MKLLVLFLLLCGAGASSLEARPQTQSTNPVQGDAPPEYLKSAHPDDRGADPVFQAKLVARFSSRGRIEYPYEARLHGWVGVGLYRVTVDPAGKIVAVKVVKSTGHTVLDNEVLSTLSTWKAKAGPRLIVDVPITFTLDGSGSRGDRRPFGAEHPFQNLPPQPAPGYR